MRILIVEDNQRLAHYIQKAFHRQGYVIDCMYDGESGEHAALTEDYDLIVLDILLPKKDGITVCKDLRRQDIAVPVLALTARSKVDDKVRALDIGFDDYLVKPFELAELLARTRALLRRPQQRLPEVLVAGTLCLNTATTSVTQNGQVVPLTLREFSLLEYLMANKNQTLTREQLLDHCWDYGYDSLSNVVDVYIRRIRNKISDEYHADCIKTIRGIGYQLHD